MCEALNNLHAIQKLKSEYYLDIRSHNLDVSKDIVNHLQNVCEECKFKILNEVLLDILTHEITRCLCIYCKNSRKEVMERICEKIEILQPKYLEEYQEAVRRGEEGEASN